MGAATVLGLVPPFVGAFIYMLFRPPEYLEDVRERELEIKAMEESLGRGRQQHCPVCRADIDESFLVCPVCTTRLRQACVDLQGAARAVVAGLPVLRDADRVADADPLPAARSSTERNRVRVESAADGG